MLNGTNEYILSISKNSFMSQFKQFELKLIK